MLILEESDGGVSVRVHLEPEGMFSLNVSISYNFLIAYKQNQVTLELTPVAFSRFLSCLSERKSSKHGHSTIWSANQITIKAKSSSSHRFRDISIYRRIFILGGFWVPGILSGKLVEALLGTKPVVEQALTMASSRPATPPLRSGASGG